MELPTCAYLVVTLISLRQLLMQTLHKRLYSTLFLLLVYELVCMYQRNYYQGSCIDTFSKSSRCIDKRYCLFLLKWWVVWTQVEAKQCFIINCFFQPKQCLIILIFSSQNSAKSLDISNFLLLVIYYQMCLPFRIY